MMEKLKFKALQLGANELLTKEQMKNVGGGSGCPPNQCSVNSLFGYCSLWTFSNCDCLINGEGYISAYCAGE
jgi:hypothetical protein